VPRLRILAAAALVLALAASAVAVTQTERQGGRDVPEATPGRLASVQSNRYAYWKVALRTGADHPLRGVGSGGFQAEWLRERPFREPVRDAHSLYLETPAELGLVGLALLLALFGAVAAACRRTASHLPGPVAALAAYALHAGVDWDWELPALTLVALTLAGLVLATSPARSAGRGARAP
jgi:O-antigen ligase